ncbi:RNA polymerase sigma factor [Paenibacillus cookii]|jgi:RNA polymerase sigma-70 factor (ECF subfamily)|uniref:RNA polymerase sigma factor n=1 Tax=Paenibacillus cookii TaxID=157839 RepID=A0ABQ4LWS7_9BACL|nr:sigma-70 family RNA polymerase sigma factor [Paenibacillus cookii]KHF35491.1 ECF RNA polymerase sigma factor SigK [Paenibacillus sp. P1XP2]GIO67398.1 RNA polymerase sigma factor [Paenibacillus cookii]
MEEHPAEWLKEIARGSASAFNRFYDAYAPMVFRLAEHWLKDAAEAEDVCQEIFIEVMQRADQYDPERGSVEAWLAVRVRSRAMDRLRKKQRIAAMEQSEANLAESERALYLESAELEAFRHLDRERIRHAMRGIPPLQRMALYGSYIMQLSHRELADRMQKPVGTVKSLIRYGIRNLRGQLQENQTKQAANGGEAHAFMESGKWE